MSAEVTVGVAISSDCEVCFFFCGHRAGSSSRRLGSLGGCPGTIEITSENEIILQFQAY